MRQRVPDWLHREEVAILVRCWVPEARLREFMGVIARATIYSPAEPRDRPPHGAVWLEGDRLEDSCWDHIQGLLDPTGTVSRRMRASLCAVAVIALGAPSRARWR